MIKLNLFYWKLYKESQEGKEAIASFERIIKPNLTAQEAIDLQKKYQYLNYLNTSRDFELEDFEYISRRFPRSVRENKEHNLDYDDVKAIFNKLADGKTEGYKFIISYIKHISTILYSIHPDIFIPYYFLMKYKYLLQILEDYDIEIDEMPGKGSMEDRCMYYLNICKSLHEFRRLNGLTSPELCAFLYDLERKAYDSKYAELSKPFPKVWMISGTKKTEEEAFNPSLFWQANTETKKGDILIFFENKGTWLKQNNSSITGIWTALEDGDRDPLFYYYGSTLIGNEIKIKPIPYKVIKADDRLNKLPRCGAGFLGLHGDPVDIKRFENLLNFIEEWDPTFDRRRLPKMHEPYKAKVRFEDRGKMKPEKWVEEYLIKEMLEQMGWNRIDVDYCRQVHLQMGRKKMENEKVQDGKTDFSLFPFGPKLKRADVLIEAKAPGEMDGNDLEKTFWQAESYASHQYAGLIILADGDKVVLYPKQKDGTFKFKSDAKSYSWEQVFNDVDVFNSLRDYILKFKVHSKTK